MDNTQASPAPKKKILWTEDDKLIGSILTQKIQSSGFELLRATNGAEAFKILETTIPDIIVVDLLLPDMNGFDILEKAAADPRLKDVPRMVLSNLDEKSDKERARQLGASKFLVKAVTPLDQIIVEIRSLAK